MNVELLRRRKKEKRKETQSALISRSTATSMTTPDQTCPFRTATQLKPQIKKENALIASMHHAWHAWSVPPAESAGKDPEGLRVSGIKLVVSGSDGVSVSEKKCRRGMNVLPAQCERC